MYACTVTKPWVKARFVAHWNCAFVTAPVPPGLVTAPVSAASTSVGFGGVAASCALPTTGVVMTAGVVNCTGTAGLPVPGL